VTGFIEMHFAVVSGVLLAALPQGVMTDIVITVAMPWTKCNRVTDSVNDSQNVHVNFRIHSHGDIFVYRSATPLWSNDSV